MKKYEKPTVSTVLLNESICADDCVTIKEHFNNSGKPLPKDFSFNIQCGKGGYDNTIDNLHAVVSIKAGEAWRINASGSWTKCDVTGWQGAGMCEYKILKNLGKTGSGCYEKADLVQVYRNGSWQNVSIEWYGPKYTGSGWNKTLTWVRYTGN